MNIKLLDFEKDDAAQDLLGRAGVDGDYEEIIKGVSLDILRRDAPECEIESIRFIGETSCKAGGMPMEENSTHIVLGELNICFNLELIVSSDAISKHKLQTIFEFDCREIDKSPKNVFTLHIKDQEKIKI